MPRTLLLVSLCLTFMFSLAAGISLFLTPDQNLTILLLKAAFAAFSVSVITAIAVMTLKS